MSILTRLTPFARRFDPKAWIGKLCGVAIGLLGGWVGALFGLVLGHLVDLLIEGWRTDRRILAYLEYPQSLTFAEPVPGAAAFCALAALIAQASATGKQKRGGRGAAEFSLVSMVARRCCAFLGCAVEDQPILEQFVRLAASNAQRVNPDLLSESLAARRAPLHDKECLSEDLSLFVQGPEGQELADRISSTLNPGQNCVKRPEWLATDLEEAWAILGLAPGTEEAKVKAAFRTLAARFHPDSVRGLGVEKERVSAEAFMKIEKAYRLVMRSLKEKA